ncbi:MAG: hypothetical protein EOO39_05510 [Cytophagaceae bacterium]|nr:MAG: hypothetical protein EOO39_05510 [Cytophagaceae bacterium]
MQEFLTYFLSHMPSNEQWLAFLLVNLFAYAAAQNTVLRRERRAEQKALNEWVTQMEAERRLHNHLIDELDQRNKEYWTMIQKQSNQIERLTNQLNAARTIHLN